MWTLLQNALLVYCMLYTDCPGGKTDTVARHVSFLKLLVFKRFWARQ